MIILYAFGPAFGLPDPSPFVTKAEILLKMANVSYKVDSSGALNVSPKGKIPFIKDGDKLIGDSTFIRFHLESQYGINFNANTDSVTAATAWLAEKYCEESLYFNLVASRWLNDENFNRGPRHFFDKVPALVRSIVTWKIRGNVRKTLWLQGFGRHSEAEQIKLAERGIQALSDTLGAKPFFGGEEPCGSDASIAAFLVNLRCEHFTGPYAALVNAQSNLVDYCERMMARFYPSVS